MIQCIFLIFSGLCGALLANYQKSVGALLFVSSVFTAVGVAIFGTLSSDTSNFETKAYGFELLLVIGLGLMMPPIFSSSKSNTTIQILVSTNTVLSGQPLQKKVTATLTRLNQLR